MACPKVPRVNERKSPSPSDEEVDQALLLLLGRIASNGAALEDLAQDLLRHLVSLPDGLADLLLPDDMSGTLDRLRHVASVEGLPSIAESTEQAVRGWCAQAANAWRDRSRVIHARWSVSSCSEDLLRVARRRPRATEVEYWTLDQLQAASDGLVEAAYAVRAVWQTMDLDVVDEELPRRS